ncbi:MAG TPA: hypothetical protein VNA32_07605, partial [Actinomycetota bacterium]|nr:hypothetical protein [Actinomycetota bacterium]
MTTLRQDQFSDFDVGLNGVGYVLDADQESPFQLQAPDDALERTNLDPQLEQNVLDTLYWGRNRSWHEGQGQTRLDVPPRFQIDPSTASSPYKHLRSKGVDITTKGQLSLLHKTSLALALTNQDPNPQKIAVTDSYAFVVSGPQTVQRFSTVTASDAASQSLNAASTGVALDLATDGGIAYVALGIDGINRALTPTTTQQDSADSATNWAATNGTLTLDTSDKKEGTGSIKVVSGLSSPLTVRKTFAAAKDFSGVDYFYYWAKLEGTVAGLGVELRAETTAGTAYYSASVGQSFIQGGGGWIRFQIPRAASFTTTVGSPSWTNINSFAWIITSLPSGCIFHLDDLDTQVLGNWAAWGTWDARVLGWANDQLFAAGIKSGTQWRFYQAASGTGGQEIYVLPDGWTVTCIRALGGMVYVSAYRGGKGIVYVYDGQNVTLRTAAPFEALGNGTIPLALAPFAGAGMLILCRRLTSTASGGLGVVYRGFPDAAGALRVERVALLGTDDGRDYAPRCGIAYGDFAYYGWNYGDEPSGENFLVDQTKRSGIGIYIPETGGYGRSYLSAPGTSYSGIVEDCSVFKGRRIFTVGGVGLFVEQTTYEPEGGAVSSLIDVNVSADKVWLAEETYYANPEAIASPVAHAYSLDGTTWLNDTSAANAATVRMRTSFKTLGLKTPAIYARVRLLSTGGVTGPMVYQTGIGGYPATKPLPAYVLSIRAFPSSERLDIARTHLLGDGWRVLNQLLTLQQNQTVVEFQPPWAFSDPANPVSYWVRVSDVQASKGWNSNGA